jgi:thioredoxin reductase (NADPH)
VVGGGNSAFEEGLFLTRFASQVDIVVHSPQAAASQVAQEKVAEQTNMKVTYNHDVREFKVEDNHLAGILVQDRAGGAPVEWQYDGVFIFIGFTPNSELLKGKADFDKLGAVLTDKSMMSSIPGIFAAGDVRAGSTKQAASAAGEGAAVALMLRQYLRDNF